MAAQITQMTAVALMLQAVFCQWLQLKRASQQGGNLSHNKGQNWRNQLASRNQIQNLKCMFSKDMPSNAMLHPFTISRYFSTVAIYQSLLI
eukprot:m.257895 g.257895  ORF g.257895 m.257895 type:complete len:91 (-) comp15534_c7_seq20:559-831(-)